MADLHAFVVNIQRRAKQVDKRVNSAVAQTVVAIDQSVVLSTPVDTGRARANWLPSLDIPITEPTEDTLQTVTLEETLGRTVALMATRKLGQTVFITNNVHYIGLLNNGSSEQAPKNFVMIAINEGIAFLRRQKIII